MTEVTSTLTIEDIRKMALPLSTRVVTGDGLLNKPVTWTTVVYPEDKLASKTVQAGEIILVAASNHSANLNAYPDIIRWASEQKAAAIVASTEITANAVALAKAYSIPILSLTDTKNIRQIEKTIVSLLVNRKGQAERRGIQIYKELTQISSQNEGMAELIGAMARLTNKAVVIQDKRLHVIAQQEQTQFLDLWEQIEQYLRKEDNLPVELHDRHRVSEIDQPVLLQSLSIPGLARLISPVITKGIGRGFLSIIGKDTELDEIDQLVTEHGAAACALEMAKQKAVSETEKRLRGTFLDRLLLGDVSQQEAIRQGERFEHDMTQIHIAIVVSWRGDNPPSMRRLETMVNTIIGTQSADALVWRREKENEVVVFCATDPENPIDHSLSLANAFAKEINRQYPQNRVAIGLGQSARDINAWRASYRDAVQAMELAERLQTDTPLYIGDLGVYQLILSLSDRDKLTEFCQKTLGDLSNYDNKQSADLVKTLEAFFNCHGNLSQTAEELIVHRNTLLYRMNRINEIASIDLDRPETRLALHLALTIRRLLALN